jgi:hypothetical protein
MPRRGFRNAAVVSLCGEHDLATIPEIASALEPLVGDVNKSEALKVDGYRIDLLAPPGSPIRRILEIIHVQDLLQVHDRRPEFRA